MPSILIIDDDVTLLARLGAQLEGAGFQVSKSSDLGHGEVLFGEQRPDMVILEVRSGDDRGWELLGRLAAETLVLVLSGANREEDVVRALEEGAVDHVAKPYRSGELLARIKVRMTIPVAAPVDIGTPVAAPAHVPPATTAQDAIDAHRATRRKNPRGAAPVDATVFMSEAEEMALLRAAPAPEKAEGAPTIDLGDGGLGKRMRAERVRRHLTLVQIENELKIRMSYLQAMEDEKLTLLPRGPAAPQMVKDYADYLGLDPSAALGELQAQHYGETVAPIPALGGTRAPRGVPRWTIILAAVLLALAVGVGAILLFDPGFFMRLPEFLRVGG